MAVLTTNSVAHPGIFSSLGGVFKRIGLFLISISESNRRMVEFQRLAELSDAQLAEQGLRREELARHLFGAFLR